MGAEEASYTLCVLRELEGDTKEYYLVSVCARCAQ